MFKILTHLKNQDFLHPWIRNTVRKGCNYLNLTTTINTRNDNFEFKIRTM